MEHILLQMDETVSVRQNELGKSRLTFQFIYLCTAVYLTVPGLVRLRSALKTHYIVSVLSLLRNVTNCILPHCSSIHVFFLYFQKSKMSPILARGKRNRSRTDMSLKGEQAMVFALSVPTKYSILKHKSKYLYLYYYFVIIF